MGKPYSVDLRLAVVRSIEAGYTREEAAELHGVSLSSVGRFIKSWRARKRVEAVGGHHHAVCAVVVPAPVEILELEAEVLRRRGADVARAVAEIPEVSAVFAPQRIPKGQVL